MCFEDILSAGVSAFRHAFSFSFPLSSSLCCFVRDLF